MNRSKGFLVAVVSSLLVLSLLLILPFIQYVLGAVLLAYVLYPLYIRLEDYISPMVAALSLVLLAVVAVIAPFAIVLARVAESADRIIQNFDAEITPVQVIESEIERLTGQELDIASELVGSGREIGTIAFDWTIGAFETITFHLIGVALALFLVYYFLTAGTDLLEWVRQLTPLPTDIQDDLYAEVDNVIKGVLFGHVFVAIVQGLVAGVGLVATGIPNAVFWTAVMIVLAMVPIVGAIPVWGGAVVYLYFTNEPLLAAGLFVYSVVVVGLTDDYLRPFAVDRYAKLNPAVILVGILGGAYAFGVMGLFFGPVVLGALKASLNIGVANWSRVGEADGGS